MKRLSCGVQTRQMACPERISGWPGGPDCANNCTECKPRSLPRLTPADSVFPLTGGPFDSKIHTVRLERFERAAAPSALRFKGWSVSLLIIVLPLLFPPRSAPDLGRPAESKDSRNHYPIIVVCRWARVAKSASGVPGIIGSCALQVRCECCYGPQSRSNEAGKPASSSKGDGMKVGASRFVVVAVITGLLLVGGSTTAWAQSPNYSPDFSTNSEFD